MIARPAEVKRLGEVDLAERLEVMRGLLFAIEVVDRLVLLERGRVVVEGPASEMRDDPRIAQAYLGDSAT